MTVTAPRRLALAFVAAVGSMAVALLLGVLVGNLAVRDAIYALVAAVVAAGGVALLIKLARSKGTPRDPSNGG